VLDLWSDLETLFGEPGACGGCWGMLWHLTRKQLEAPKGDGNKQATQPIVDAIEVPGALACHGANPTGWCAIDPRSAYCASSRCRVLKQLLRELGYPVE
jgi:hypothetical protein